MGTPLGSSSPYGPPGLGRRPRPRGVRWLPVVVGAVLAAIAVLLLLVAFYPQWFGLPGAAGPGHLGVFGGAFLLLFVLLIVFFIVRVAFWSSRAARYRRWGGPGGGGYGPDRPVLVARMRYARGEITKEQFDQIMNDLRRPPGAP